MKRQQQDQMILREFGMRLRDERTKKRFSVLEMAERVGVSARSYQRMESGVGSVGLVHYVNASSLLDLDFNKTFSELLATSRRRVRKTRLIPDDEVQF